MTTTTAKRFNYTSLCELYFVLWSIAIKFYLLFLLYWWIINNHQKVQFILFAIKSQNELKRSAVFTNIRQSGNATTTVDATNRVLLRLGLPYVTETRRLFFCRGQTRIALSLWLCTCIQLYTYVSRRYVSMQSEDERWKYECNPICRYVLISSSSLTFSIFFSISCFLTLKFPLWRC